MKNTFKYQLITLFFVIFMVCFTLAFYALGWEEPTAAPPGSNIDVPINIGGIGQIKTGALGIEGVLRGYSALVITGNSTNPVAGTCPGGYDWYDDGDTIIEDGECKITSLYSDLNGRIGIGTTNPTEKLQVNDGDILALRGDVCTSDGAGTTICLSSVGGGGGGTVWESDWYYLSRQRNYSNGSLDENGTVMNLTHNLGSDSFITQILLAPDTGGNPDLAYITTMDKYSYSYGDDCGGKGWDGVTLHHINNTDFKIRTGEPSMGEYINDAGTRVCVYSGWVKIIPTASGGGGGGAPGGVNAQIQYNDNGSFGGAEIYYDSANSRLGIGTSSPQAKLDVNGGIKVGSDNICNGNKIGTIRYNNGIEKNAEFKQMK